MTVEDREAMMAGTAVGMTMTTMTGVAMGTEVTGTAMIEKAI
jgi:hypothetical protein